MDKMTEAQSIMLRFAQAYTRPSGAFTYGGDLSFRTAQALARRGYLEGHLNQQGSFGIRITERGCVAIASAEGKER